MLHGTMNCVNLSTFNGPSPFNSPSPLVSFSSSPLITTNCPSPSSSQFDPLESLWPNHISDEVSDLALQACHQEVKRVSDHLRISPDPYTWTGADVISWISWQQKQLGLPMFPLSYFQMDGMRLCSMSEADFKVRAQGAGDLLYAQLDIWKTLSEQESMKRIDLIVTSDYGSEGIQSDDELSQDGACPVSSPSSMSPSSVSSSTSVTFSPFPAAPSPLASPSSTSHSPSVSMIPGNGPVTPSPNRNASGSHIHLWQFLKELLAQSQYGSCIRWIDRTKGIFKIEDSVRVAKLWGRRKNRPAMNYDKLSRSIRQYYKKGIMKKTERSQRLVYQFCQPYCF